ncbi:MAG: phage tail protein [Bacteroidales bacterium]|nr:phage tail protein [Bacteroidales bacterium]
MIDYYDGQITDLMPPSYSSEATVKALSAALRAGTRILRQYAQYAYVYCSIDTLPDEILDMLAIELRTQYYSDQFDIETKRALIRNTLTWYMYAGTPMAVEELIDIIFGSGEVKEWFEYGGTKYGFAIITDELLTDVAFDYFFEMVKRVKNTRSHLMAIVAERESEHTVHAGVGQWQTYINAPVLEQTMIGD